MSDFALPILQRPRRRKSALAIAAKRQIQVLHALMLHDIKSRYFGNGLGYVVTILWPSAHMALVMSIFLLRDRPIPYGNSAALYAATGVVPFIAWNYISRFVCLGVIQNRSFLAYPIIKPLDMMMARLALEIVSSFIITSGVLLILTFCGVDVMPLDLGQAAAGLLSAVALGIGFGIFNGVICMIQPFWQIAYVLIIVVFWLTAGLAINPEALPDSIGYWLSWNPLLHSIEWIRSAYYFDYPAHLLDKSYLLWVASSSLVLGLIGERVLRRYLLK